MWTFIIIGGLVCIALVAYVICHNTETHCLSIAMVVAITAGLLCWGSYGISTTNLPAGYERVKNYSYVTETGTSATLKGPYFKMGDTYYKQELGKAHWIPFAQCDYVEVDLPQSALYSNTSPANEADKFCTSCGNELNTKDKFCSSCGTEIKERES